MQIQFHKIASLFQIILLLLSCEKRVIVERAPIEYVKSELDKLAPVEIKCDLSNLSESEIQVIRKLIEAGKVIDELFLLQVDRANPEIREELKKSRKADDKVYLDMFSIMFGSWNRIDSDKPFINNKEKPRGAGLYPESLTKEQFEAFINENPHLKDEFTNNFTVIRYENGKLKSIPYHKEYHHLVKKLSELLSEAAEISEEPTLRNYLNLRAKGLLTDNYFDSDVAWIDLDGNIETVFGPYEVYEDRLFGYKAAYEAFICIVDQEESKKLAIITEYLDEMERNLPIPEIYKSSQKGLSSPIKVVNEIFSAGDTKAGVQTTAFVLPNDERVRQQKGSKKVLLKNVAEAKYEKCWIPIVSEVLSEELLKNVSFEAYFNHVLMHEISHGLGPQTITLSDGEKSTVSKELKDLYPVIEECKADVLGIYNLNFLVERGVFPENLRYSVFPSYVGGMFRSIRFGIDSAHGGAAAMQFNYLLSKGAIFLDEMGKLKLDEKKMKRSIEEIANEILMIQALGDYESAKRFVEKYCRMTMLMKTIIESLKGIPVDIRPIYPEI